MTITATPSDTELLRRVRVELEWNPRVDGTDIAATVNRRVVTLTGTVDAWAKKQAILEAVHQIAGVLDVADEIQVRAPGRAKTDEELAEAVRSALSWDVFVPDERIRSTVSGGWVELEGNVDRLQQHDDAIRCVERLTGVIGVTDKIAIKPPQIDASRIRMSIKDALTRRAEREAHRIGVTVFEGVVTLTGTVDSWAEKNSLGQLAAYSPCVSRVVNEIVVDPYT